MKDDIDPTDTINEQPDTLKVSIAGREFTLSWEQAETLAEELRLEIVAHKLDPQRFFNQRLNHMWPYLPDSKFIAPYPNPIQGGNQKASLVIDYENPVTCCGLGNSYGNEGGC